MEIDPQQLVGTDAEPAPVDSVAPLVFAFRPTSMVRVAEDKLAEWEALFAERVGFQPPPRGSEQGLRNPFPGETISSCGDWDDCDYHA